MAVEVAVNFGEVQAAMGARSHLGLAGRLDVLLGDAAVVEGSPMAVAVEVEAPGTVGACELATVIPRGHRSSGTRS